MQYLNLDDNEFLNLRLANPKLAKRKLLPNIKRRRKKVLDKKILTNPKYSAECLKKASMIRFASNEAIVIPDTPAPITQTSLIFKIFNFFKLSSMELK